MGEDPSALRRQVDDTRAQLGETVNALAYKVSAPRRLADQASAALRTRKRQEAIVVAGAFVVVALTMAGLSIRRRRR